MASYVVMRPDPKDSFHWLKVGGPFLDSREAQRLSREYNEQNRPEMSSPEEEAFVIVVPGQY